MPVQTTVSDTLPKGFAGGTRHVVRGMTCINTEATLGIPLGVFVVQDKTSGQLTNPQAALLPRAATDTFLGVNGGERYIDSDFIATGLKPGTPFYVVQSGEALVRVETAVVKGNKAFVRFAVSATTPALTQLGAVRADADTGTAVELDGAYFKESGAAGELVWLRWDDTAIRATQ